MMIMMTLLAQICMKKKLYSLLLCGKKEQPNTNQNSNLEIIKLSSAFPMSSQKKISTLMRKVQLGILFHV